MSVSARPWHRGGLGSHSSTCNVFNPQYPDNPPRAATGMTAAQLSPSACWTKNHAYYNPSSMNGAAGRIRQTTTQQHRYSGCGNTLNPTICRSCAAYASCDHLR